jgi:NAD(P)H-dependent flavin oxidoreductase YrpB (nitropropane dioxygenase family)
MLHTPLCDLLGIDVPIFAAPMGFITGPELAAAVSNAGGLGIMSFSGSLPPVLHEQIRRRARIPPAARQLLAVCGRALSGPAGGARLKVRPMSGPFPGEW